MVSHCISPRVWLKCTTGVFSIPKGIGPSYGFRCIWIGNEMKTKFKSCSILLNNSSVETLIVSNNSKITDKYLNDIKLVKKRVLEELSYYLLYCNCQENTDSS